MKVESHHRTQDVTELYGLPPPRRHVSLAWVTAPLWPRHRSRFGSRTRIISERLHENQTQQRQRRRRRRWALRKQQTYSQWLPLQWIDGGDMPEKHSFSESDSLDSSWRSFQSRGRDAKTLSQAGKIQQVHKVVTRWQEFTWTSGLIHSLLCVGCYIFVCWHIMLITLSTCWWREDSLLQCVHWRSLRIEHIWSMKQQNTKLSWEICQRVYKVVNICYIYTIL